MMPDLWPPFFYLSPNVIARARVNLTSGLYWCSQLESDSIAQVERIEGKVSLRLKIRQRLFLLAILGNNVE